MIFPGLKKKENPEVVKKSYLCMGLMVVNYYQEHKNFVKLFLDQLEKKKTGKDFKDFDMYALFVLFDSVITNDMTDIDEELNVHTNQSKNSFAYKFDEIVKKYLYFSHKLPVLITVIGLCKVLLQDRISNPEYQIARLIALLYKSQQFKTQEGEDYFTKISEIMNNFLYVYTISSKSHFNSLINSIILLITTGLYSDSIVGFQKFSNTTATDFLSINYEYLNKLLVSTINTYVNSMKIRNENKGFLINESDNLTKLKKATQKKVMLRIIKKLIFIQFTFCDPEMCLLKLKDKEKDKDNNLSNINININTVNENNSAKDDDKSTISFIIQRNILKNIKNLLGKTVFSNALINEFNNDDQVFSIKFFSILHLYNDSYGLETISDELKKFYNKLSEKEFIVEVNNMKINLLESFESCKNYLNDKKEKYSMKIKDEYSFILSLKSESHYDGIIEEDEYDEEDDEQADDNDDDKKVKSKSAGNKNSKNQNQSKNSNLNEENINEDNDADGESEADVNHDDREKNNKKSKNTEKDKENKKSRKEKSKSNKNNKMIEEEDESQIDSVIDSNSVKIDNDMKKLNIKEKAKSNKRRKSKK